jgi:hypothetical protein
MNDAQNNSVQKDKNNKGGVNMARNNRKVVPEAQNALEKMKYEIASEVGVNLKQGYNGDITARDAGKIGGNMVKKMIELAERQLAGK